LDTESTDRLENSSGLDTVHVARKGPSQVAGRNTGYSSLTGKKNKLFFC